MIRVEHGDCREIIPTLGVTVDAVVTDPPYDLVAMTKRFGNGQAAAKSPDHQRFARGFMNQTWDATGVAFDPETWRVIGEALRPGGFLVAFGGCRTHHRMTCAIEDSGFIIQDCIMWLNGQGFPKRRDMLKPAYEPIVLAYKPGGKRTMQIDECRIGTGPSPSIERRKSPASASMGWRNENPAKDFNQVARSWSQPREGETLGRWPANICHDGSDEVVAAFPESAGQQGDVRGTEPSEPFGGPIYGHGLHRQRALRIGDSGSAARFFFSAKAGAQDRWGSRHPTVKPVDLMKWLVALVCPPGGTVLDPFAGSGTTAVAALGTGRNAILIEREDQYVADIRERVAFYEGGGAHSVQAKNRNRKTDAGPLFADPAFDEAADAARSYDAAIQAIGERVKAGEPLPTGGYFGGVE